VKVVATAQGYDNVAIREIGDVFELQPGMTLISPWYHVLDETPVQAEARLNKLAELAAMKPLERAAEYRRLVKEEAKAK
jgi:hypothetical protein